MTQKNSLMEWIQQTRKISKEIDYITADTIDSINTVLPLVHRHAIMENQEFFDEMCERYHKPNTVKLLKKRSVEPPMACAGCQVKGVCGSILSKYVEASVLRCKKAMELVRFQWWEIVDFMWERPELVDPNLVKDEYVRTMVSIACAGNKKNNPLENGIKKKFGKYWKDENGEWHKEKRKRF